MIEFPPLSTPAPAQGDVWDHLLKPGRYPGTATQPNGEKIPVVQVVTDTGLRRALTALNRLAEDPNWPGLLLDVEHASLGDEGSTAAAAWYRQFDLRPDGLYGKAERTTLGTGLIQGKVYKRLSPVAELEPLPGSQTEYLVVGINSAGLTNKANMTALRILAANRETLSITPTQTKESNMPTQLLELLGLTAEATEADVLAAVTALKDQLATHEAEKTDREAEAFAAANADKFKGGKDDAKDLYVKNRAAAEAVVAHAVGVAAPAPAEAPRVLNRQDTRTPARPVTAVTDPDAEANAAAQSAAALCANRAVELQRQNPNMSYAVAFERAANEQKAKTAK